MRAGVLLDQQIEGCRMGELRSLSEAAVGGIEHVQRRFHNCVHDARIELPAASGERLSLGDGAFHHPSLSSDFTLFFLKGIGNGQ